MHASGLQDFQIGTIFPPDKLERSIGIRAMRARVPALDCTERFTPRTRRREHRVILALKENQACLNGKSSRQWARLAKSPISHAKIINPDIVSHDELAGDFSRVLLATRPEAI